MAIFARWRILILLGFTALLAACAAPAASTPTYTVLPSATATLPPIATPTELGQAATPQPPTETQKQPAPLPRPSSTPVVPPTPTPTLPPWTPAPYTPPTAHPLALSPANAGQMQELAVLGNGRPADVAWSPDGKLLAVAAYDRVDLYDTTSWERAARYPLLAEYVAFSPAGGFLVAAWGDTVRWLDLATGTVVREQVSAVETIRSIHFSPGGNWLALLGTACFRCGDPDYALEMLDAATGVTQFTRFEYGLSPALAFSPDGRTLALTFEFGTVLLDANTGTELAHDTTDGFSVAFISDGSELLVLTESGLQILTLASGEWADVPGPLPETSFVFSPDGRSLAFIQPVPYLTDPENFTVWDWATQQMLVSVPTTRAVRRAAFSPDSRQVAWVDDTSGVHIVDLAAPTVLRTLPYNPSLTAVAFGPPSAADSPTVLSGDEYGGLWSWNPNNTLLFHRSAPTISHFDGVDYYSDDSLGGVVALDYSPSEGLLLTSYRVGEVHAANPATGQMVYALPCPNVEYSPVRVNRAGSVFMGPCGSRQAQVAHDLRTGTRLAVFDRRLLEINGQWVGVDFRYPSGGSSYVIALTRLNGGVPLTLTLPAQFEIDDNFMLIASPDGHWLAANTSSADIVIWDAVSGLPVFDLSGHTPFYGDGASAGITVLRFGPSTNLLVSVGVDGTVRLWDPATGTELRRFDVGSVSDLAFSADGRYLAASSWAGFVSVWGLPSP